MPKQFAAAKSLFNSPENRAQGGAREQTVLTPDWLLDAIREVAPIGLDPCTTAENPTGAAVFMAAPAQDGLKWDWVDAMDLHGARGLVYVNPPYSDLMPWMRKCFVEAEYKAHEEVTSIYLLAPYRPQRRWFNEYTKGYTVVSLAPFPFKGHKQAFPAPLCLVCYNLPVPHLGKYETGRWIQK